LTFNNWGFDKDYGNFGCQVIQGKKAKSDNFLGKNQQA
jgi:hypothetical protein